MPVPLVVNNVVYQYPANRDVPGYGGEATAWAQAITNQLASVAGPADILNTVASISNNQTSPAIIPGLSFSTSVVLGAKVDYNVYRVTSTNEVVEQGMMLISYKPVAMTWDIVILSSQSSNVVFSISNTGQVQYTSDNMPGINYTGSITFRALGLV